MSAERICPTCGGTGLLDLAASVDEKIEQLRAECRELGIVVGAGGTVTEPDAARLLNRAPGTLANWRAQGMITFRRLNGRIRYSLRDLAAWLVENEQI